MDIGASALGGVNLIQDSAARSVKPLGKVIQGKRRFSERANQVFARHWLKRRGRNFRRRLGRFWWLAGFAQHLRHCPLNCLPVVPQFPPQD